MREAHPQRHGDELHATPESIAAAKEANARERARIMAETGLSIDDAGHIGLLIGQGIAAAVLVTGSHRHRG